MTSHRWAVIASWVVSGCAELPPSREVVQAGAACPPSLCPGNSPIIKTYRFHDLSMRGLPNAEQLAIERFEKDTVKYDLEVANGRLAGHSGSGDISGGSLVNATITIRRDAGPGGPTERFDVRIVAVD